MQSTVKLKKEHSLSNNNKRAIKLCFQCMHAPSFAMCCMCAVQHAKIIQVKASLHNDLTSDQQRNTSRDPHCF